MAYKISIIPGDGIGPYVVEAAKEILIALADRFGFSIDFVEAPAGDIAKKELGSPMPEESFKKIVGSDACLKGPVGETAKDVIVFLRQKLDLYANIRPFKSFPFTDAKYQGIDMVIVRENTEDLYRCVEDVTDDYAVALMVLTKKGCSRIARVAFKYASRRRKLLTVIHKSNVLRSFNLLRDAVKNISMEFPDVKVEEMLVDNAAYQLVTNPKRFDVMLTTNMFGDILSDEAAGLIGSLGVAPSANIGDNFGIFEPVHGSAPDLDPKYANPLATIMASGMMLTWLYERKMDRRLLDAHNALMEAIDFALSKKECLTPDIGGGATMDKLLKTILRAI